MFKDEIKEIRKENREAKLMMYKEVIILYLKCWFYYPQTPQLRKKLVDMTRGFFKCLKNENEILNLLGEARISQEEFDDFIFSLNSLFERTWDYYDGVLGDFEVAMEINQLHRVLMQKNQTKMIDDEKKELLLRLIKECEKEK